MDITPFIGCNLPGLFEKRTMQDIYLVPPYVRSVVISNGDETVAIISVDILYVYWQSYTKILKRISDNTGIKPENILVCATHSHSGGPADYDIMCEEDDVYVQMVWRKAADSVILAYRNMKRANLFYGSTQVNDISFVRNYYMKDGSIQTNPGNLNPNIVRPITDIDPTYTIIVCKNCDDQVLGTITNFAVHPCTYKGDCAFGEFPAILEDELMKIYGIEFISVFLNGANGNIVSNDHTKEFPEIPGYFSVGRKLAESTQYIINNSLKKIESTSIASIKENFWVQRRVVTEQQIEKAKRNMNYSHSGMNKLNAVRVLEYAELSKTLGSKIPLVVQVIKIGDFAIHAIPCEIFVQTGKRIKSLTPLQNTMIASLSNGSCLYVLPKELLDADIFEGQPNTNFYESDTVDIICEKALKLANELNDTK